LANISVRRRSAEAEGGGVVEVVTRVLNLRKVITWAIVVFIVYYLVSDPAGASAAVRSALKGLQSAGNSLSDFVSHL
jgi:hypothetical protein